MARVTVEDCLQNVKNRFELVITASKRARQLMRGSSEPKVAWENDKPTVVALREIAMGYTDFNDAHHAKETLHHEEHIHEIQHLTNETNETSAQNIIKNEGDEASQTPQNDDSSEISTPTGNPAESE